MIAITMWQAFDGTVHRTEKLCERYEKRQYCFNAFRSIFGSTEGCRVEFDEFHDWAIEERDWLKSYLEVTEINSDNETA